MYAMPTKNQKKMISELVEMGFDIDLAYIALLKSDFKKDQAIEDMLEKEIFLKS